MTPEEAGRVLARHELRRALLPTRRHRGNSADYLAARIARDAPDVLERAIAGEFASMKEAAREAGIADRVHEDDRRLIPLLQAWDRASDLDRLAFLGALNGDPVAIKAPKLP